MKAGSPLSAAPAGSPLSAARAGTIRATGGTVLAALVALLAFVKWLQSGSAVVLFVAGASVAALLLDIFAARFLVGRARLTVSSGTYDAIVGDTITLRLSVAGVKRPVSVRGAGVDRGLPTVQIDPPGSAKMPCVVGPRGVFSRLEVEVFSTGLSGLAIWGREGAIAFPEPIFVGPTPVDPSQALPDLAFSADQGTPRPSISGDIVRGVRPYARGDALRRVHWPATARTGELMVMEVEEPVTPRLLIVLNLRQPGHAAEQAAGRAAWYANEGIQRDYDVRIATMEVAGPVVRRVSAQPEVNRCLAAAVVSAQPVAGSPLPAARAGSPLPAARAGSPLPAARAGSGGFAAVAEISDEGDRWVW